MRLKLMKNFYLRSHSEDIFLKNFQPPDKLLYMSEGQVRIRIWFFANFVYVMTPKGSSPNFAFNIKQVDYAFFS